MKKIIDSLKYIKLSDFLSPFAFVIALLPAFFLKIINKIKKRRLWLVCEEGICAKDNGYHFFRFIRINHPNDYCYFVIDRKCHDFKKIEELGNYIQFKSLKHWIYYLAAEYNISTQKMGNPNQVFFYVYHVIFGFKRNRVFLQHGITFNDSPWIYYKDTKFRYFICGAKKEYNFIIEKFGYPKENVKYTGFPRFDNLYNNNTNSKQIVIMPTWRNWLGRDRNNLTKSIEFKNTEYYKRWNGLLNNKDFVSFIEENNYQVFFYPHFNMKKFISCFNVESKNIKIVDNSNTDLQQLLKESQLLVTDYSSVFMDFAYMNKPLIMYQFDVEKFMANHLKPGYFNYKKDGFGPVVTSEKKCVEEIRKVLKDGVEPKYIKRSNDFFKLKDQKNCSRIYELLIKRG